MNRVIVGLALALVASGAIALAWNSTRAQNQEGARAGESSETTGKITITDSLGRQVTLPKPPKRVACLVSFTSEMALELGITPILRPLIPDEHIYPPAAKDVPTISVNHSAGPDMEVLAAAKPDVIFLSPVFGRFIQTLEEKLLTPVVCLKIDDVDQVSEQFLLMGKIFDREAKAAELVAAHKGELAKARASTANSGLKVAALFGTPNSFLSFMPESYLGSMLRGLNCTLVATHAPNKDAAGPKRQTAPMSLEILVAADPDVILLVYHGPPSSSAVEMQKEPAWQAMKAVKNGRVHRISEWPYVVNPGLGAVKAEQQLKALLFPEQPKANRSKVEALPDGRLAVQR